MGDAYFIVDCPEMAFRRSHSIPIHHNGSVRLLAEELSEAMDRYENRVAIRVLREQLAQIKDASLKMHPKYLDNNSDNNDLQKLLTLINEVSID